MSIWDEIKHKFSALSIVEKLIVINTVIYIVDALVVFLFQLPVDYIRRWFELPKDFSSFILQPWSLVTYSFFHGGFMHLFWNMLLLYFVGRFSLMIYQMKQFVTVYFLGAIAGGLLYILSYNIFPVFLEVNSSLIGASAAVMAVVIFVCTHNPFFPVRLFFILTVKLWYIGVGLVLIDLISLPFSNSGGHLSHLGGALLGYVYARQYARGKDLGSKISKMLGRFSGIFSTDKKAPLRTVHKEKSSTASKAPSGKADHQKKLDAILDKISKSGYESLSKEEKDYLFTAGKD